MIAPNFGDEMWGFFNAIVLTTAIINKKGSKSNVGENY